MSLAPSVDYSDVARLWLQIAATVPNGRPVPIRPIADHFQVGINTANGWIHRCRRQGLIPASTQTRPPRRRNAAGELVDRPASSTSMFAPRPDPAALAATTAPFTQRVIDRSPPPPKAMGPARQLHCSSCDWSTDLEHAAGLARHTLSEHGRPPRTERTPGFVTETPRPDAVTETRGADPAILPAGSAPCPTAVVDVKEMVWCPAGP